MDQERDRVRQVEDARERVAQDVRSVAENANVVDRTKEKVQGKVDDAKSAVSDKLQGARDKIGSARDKLSSARDTVQGSVSDMKTNVTNNIGNLNPMENPIGMLLGGLAVGFLIGLALPVTRFESERIGPITEDMKGRVRQAGTEVMRRGGEVIKDTIEASKEAATNSLREQAKEMGIGEGGNGSSESRQ